MVSKKKLLEKSRLCGILDRQILKDRDIFAVAESILAGGADMLQLRDKVSDPQAILWTAKILRKIANKHNALLIINDRPDIAVASNADGIHIGQGDIDMSIINKIVPGAMLIGVSASNIGEARQAKDAGADYLGIGPIFHTPIKSEKSLSRLRFSKTLKSLGLPVFAIGGINAKNITLLKKYGFDRVAVIRAACAVKDPYRSVKELKDIIG